MTIRHHIEAGHYPKDDKGRAVVKMKDGRSAVICATDGPDGEELVGWHSGHAGERDAVCSWQENGCWQVKSCHLDLLPPPPRKVKVRLWIEHDPAEGYFSSTWNSNKPSGGVKPRPGCVIVELTGEYEEERR